MWCNTCWVCPACFSTGPHPCTELAVNVADDVCEDGENNSPDEVATPRKPDKGRGVARMQAKLLMAAQSGKLWDWKRALLSHCLNVLGVKLPSGGNRRQARGIAMQHVVPLLA